MKRTWKKKYLKKMSATEPSMGKKTHNLEYNGTYLPTIDFIIVLVCGKKKNSNRVGMVCM